MSVETLTWKDGALLILDQLLLPGTVEYVTCRTPGEVADTIQKMQIRGAPAIGVAAAYGMALAALTHDGPDGERLAAHWSAARERLARSRPTAVNLFWALERMQRLFDRVGREGLARLREGALAEAHAIFREDVELNRTMGHNGADLISRGARILTHCNAGSLATAGYGTALGVVRAARDQHKEISVWVDETRPYLQGARLTAWELDQENIPYTLITDNMAASLMRAGKVDLVVVGADRITSRGDVANKIGTYGLAVLCHYHHIPFYVAAPLSTIDLTLTSPDQIPIEERPHRELSHILGHAIAPANVKVFNPSFDVTPHTLVSAIITPVGVLYPPYHRSIALAFAK